MAQKPRHCLCHFPILSSHIARESASCHLDLVDGEAVVVRFHLISFYGSSGDGF